MPHYSPSRRKRRDSECCSSINLVKYMLQVFNIILLISGGAVLGTALWTIFCKFQYVPLLTTSIYIVGIYALAFAGGLAIIGGILGCCGTFYEQKFVILCYTFLLVLVFLLEAMIGGLAYFYETQIEDELKMTLNETFLTSYGVDEKRTEAIDQMQQEYTCCGAIRFEDWTESVWYKNNNVFLLREHNDRLVPDSCCITLTENCGKRDHPSNIPYTGCVYRMSDEFRHHLTIIGAIGLGICLIHIVGLILSCCLYIRLRNYDDE